MAKKSYKLTAKNKKSIMRVLLFGAAVLVLSIVVPAAFPNATGFMADVVKFFQSIQDHVKSLWMIYSLALVIFITSIK